MRRRGFTYRKRGDLLRTAFFGGRTNLLHKNHKTPLFHAFFACFAISLELFSRPYWQSGCYSCNDCSQANGRHKDNRADKGPSAMTILCCATYWVAYSKLQDMLSSGELAAADAPRIALSRHGWLIQVRGRA